MPLGSTSGNANFRVEDWQNGNLNGGVGNRALGNGFGQNFFDNSHLERLETKDRAGKKVFKLQRMPGALSGSEQSRYRQYRDRARKDVGKDGKQVWSDKMEDAFQIGNNPNTLSSSEVLRQPSGSKDSTSLGQEKGGDDTKGWYREAVWKERTHRPCH